ncbi:hypothetical protein EFA46_015435 (plasmid) [Halarchaeum sp. CBA1220]|uniref:hypothetical protein n=1 Tax=Halarchaeum sp. CBA1220 TaxID=1853682 RepID=UPI0011CE2BEE|nr:hypothetical protein [Halarchaeum sp. CBA1220]QLC35651.1 hypothetical protein EFA46_015435 [Halarchaeum sp. CBA1220]
MSTTSSSSSSSTDSDESGERTASTATINVCLRRDTHTRLTAFKNFDPFVHRTFDEAVTELLDTIEFPTPDEFESKYIPSMTRILPENEEERDD